MVVSQDIGHHLQEVGAEWGVTTGRRRRCGWLDLVQMRYSHLINGYTAFNLTKLDVLDQLKEIKVCTGYMADGKLLTTFPCEYMHHRAIMRTWDGIDRLMIIASRFYSRPGAALTGKM